MDLFDVTMEGHVWFVECLCVVVLVVVVLMGVHLKTVELPRRAKATYKDRVLDKAA